MTISVRRAAVSDLDWTLGQLRDFSAFYGTKHPLFGDEAYARRGVEGLIQDHLVFIAEKAEVGPVGLIAGWITPHPMNPAIRCLTENLWWVVPKYRTTRAGHALLNAFVDWGKAHVDWIVQAVGPKTGIHHRSLRRLGFKLQELSYLLEVH